MKSKFQQQQERLVLYKIILLISVGIFIFMIGLMTLTFYTNEHHSAKNLEMLLRSYLEQKEYNEKFLTNKDIQENCLELLAGGGDIEAFTNTIRKNSGNQTIANHLILTDIAGDVYFTTFHEEDLSSYLLNYNGAVCFHAGDSDDDEIYKAVYYNPGNYSDYIYVKTLRQDSQIVGYLSLYLSGSDWNFVLSEDNYDGVITDHRGNIIYCSRASFMKYHGKFKPENRYFTDLNHNRYWMKEYQLYPDDIIIYSLIYYPRSQVWMFGAMIVCVMGALWYRLAKSMTAAMAANNSDMINRLVREIRVIQKGNTDYRIRIYMENEFDEVTTQLNQMLDSIQDLNEKNIELMRINNTFELNQLMAQINPHFLYNTLEMIRNLVVWEPERTSSLIIKLTKILRYSVDRERQEVQLEEDLNYLMDYIDIQKSRFGERFIYEMEVDSECLKCMVPKLILQPIIENSIKYGFKEKMDIRVSVSGYIDSGMLLLVVKDDGPGLPETLAAQLNRSIRQVYRDTGSMGLHNISRRLYLQYGRGSGITIQSAAGKGMEVVVRIALEGEG